MIGGKSNKKKIVTEVSKEFTDEDAVQIKIQGGQLHVIDLKEYQVILRRIQDHCDLADANRDMYSMHRDFILNYLHENTLKEVKGITFDNMLEKLVGAWKNFTMFAMLINRLFDYIDRNYIIKNNLE